MKLFKLPLAIALSPNSTLSDILLSLKIIFWPFGWRNGPEIKKLEDDFKKYLKVKYAYSFASGREALYILLKCLGLKEGDEILLQAYTCLVVPNSIIWLGAKPIYVDIIEDTFNLDPEDLRRKISLKSKILLLQHTFGQAADLKKILAIAERNHLIVIEDCAHSLGGEYQDKKLGTFGEASFFSFGRDKVISSVSGGMITTNHEELALKIQKEQASIFYPTRWNIFQNLFHPIAFIVINLTYYWFNLGKFILWFLLKIKFLPVVLNQEEKRSLKPKNFPRRLPNALAKLAINQFKFLDKFNEYRRELAQFYENSLRGTRYQLPKIILGSRPIYLRYTVRIAEAEKIREKARGFGIILGNWYNKVIAPAYSNLDKVGYQVGSCPEAERIARESLNLPTHHKISFKKAKKVVEFLKNIALNNK